MAFNSLRFLLFFAIVYLTYLAARDNKRQNWILLGANYIFYAFWDWRFLSLLLLSTFVNFYSGLLIETALSEEKRKRALILNIAFNLGMLGVFKYFNFFTEGLRTVLGVFGIHTGYSALNIILPLGISFYTFQAISYPVDIYWRRIKPTEDLPAFAIFISFFPLIVSGPIERARNLLPQILGNRKITPALFYSGSWLIFWGLFKKIVIADNLAGITRQFFEMPSSASGGLALFMTYLFTFQLYADFSGYSDMARGVSKLLGFDIMLNFRTPFFSKDLYDLWQRWHISLTSWIKEYLYYPLALARFFGAQLSASMAIIITWAIMGLWHGANSKFIVWGLYHALLLVAYSRIRPYLNLIRPKGYITSRLWSMAQILVVFNLFSLGLVFFAAPSLPEAFIVFHNIFFNFSHPFRIGYGTVVLLAMLLAPLLVLEYFQHRSDDELILFKWPVLARAALYYALIYLLIVYGDFSVQKYYYFQF